MAHELASALQQVSRIRQCCALKEPHVYVRSEYIDVAEGRISQTCNRTAVMQKLPDFVPAFSHHVKPLLRDGDRKSTRLNSSHTVISYAVFCLKKKKQSSQETCEQAS